jgi:hypothetical protein
MKIESIEDIKNNIKKLKLFDIFVYSINFNYVDDDWKKFVDKKKIEELDVIIKDENLDRDTTYTFIKNSFRCFFFGLVICFSFRIFQPYAFNGLIDFSPKFIANIHEAHQMITGQIDYPPNIQWQHTFPLS